MLLVLNKTAKRDYTILKTLEAGIVLLGSEVKSLREKKGSLMGSFVRIINGEAFLLNVQINAYPFADNRDYDPKRTRKLLLTKKELFQLSQETHQKGLTLIPLSIEIFGKHIKVKIGLGKGKKEYEKRADLKKKAVQRDIDREVKQKIRMR